VKEISILMMKYDDQENVVHVEKDVELTTEDNMKIRQNKSMSNIYLSNTF